MKQGILEFFKRTLVGEVPIHPLDRLMAKSWIKRRLLAVYPQLRWDPEGLEAAYEALNLELQEIESVEGVEGGRECSFELRGPDEIHPNGS